MSAPTPSLPDAHAHAPDLEDLIEQGGQEAVGAAVEGMAANDLTHEVAQLEDDARERLLAMVDPELAADVIELIPETQAVDALENLPAGTAARILQEFPSDEQADLLGEMENAEAVLAELEPDEAQELRELASWSDDCAGGLMVTEFFAFQAEATVSDVVRTIQEGAEEHRDYDIQYLYVTNGEGALVGVVPLRNLLLSRRARPMGDAMIPSPLALQVTAGMDEIRAFFDQHHFLGAPVVDELGRLRGVLHRAAVDWAVTEQSEADYRHSQGIVGGEELRTMPLHVRSGRRLLWLSLNVLLNIAAASIIAMHQDTLEAVIALAVFLPIISDMSGCSGSQAVAVSMRELSLNVVRPSDALRVLWKEASVGVVNGIALGLLLGGVAWIWKGNVWLGLVVGSALALNTIVAVTIGGTIPLVLKALKKDPALASGPILTTVTDMCGFFLVLSLAAATLSRIAT